MDTGPTEEKDWLGAQRKYEMDGELPPGLREDEMHTRYSSKVEALEIRDNLWGKEKDGV